MKYSPLLTILLISVGFGQALPPFAVDAKTAPKPVKLLPATAMQVKLAPVTGGIPGNGQPLAKVDGDVLVLSPANFAVGQSFVGLNLGDDQLKPTTNYISFTAASTKSPVQLGVYASGNTALETGGGKIIVTAKPGEPQRFALPLSAFAVKGSFKRVGFGIEAMPTDDSQVRISNVTVGHAPMHADYLKSQKTVISLVGNWKFSADDGERGVGEKCFEPGFDDSKWKTLKSNVPWQQQGVKHGGWGWYRQKITVAANQVGVPLTISLAEFFFDDDVYFNGHHIGGLRGNYKYYNLLPRQYSVPADLVKEGENTIAVRVWGVDGTATNPSGGGLIPGMQPKGTYYVAEFDPYAPRLRVNGKEFPQDQFDLTDAQRGMPFDVVFRFSHDVASHLHYTLTDYYGQTIQVGVTPITNHTAIVAIDAETSKTIYLRGRFKALVAAVNDKGVIGLDVREFDRFSFAKRDQLTLPELPAKEEDTPYGKLKLIDEIDCSVAAEGAHPYMYGGFSHAQNRHVPGMAVETKVTEILGRKAREVGQGFFAYRIGRGKLKIRGNYLLRVEYPEDKPRYAAMEIQNGHNFMDLGWKNGVSADDPFDNWPLSGKWETYDAVFSLDDETVGSQGTGSTSAENGVWVYFMNKQKPGRYQQMYQGGPAIGRVRLYELDVERHSPVIRKPEGQPQRVLAVDWERQADQPPEDIVRYAKLMGYNAVSPIMLKWAFMNYGDPMPGYETTFIDRKRIWVRATAGAADEPAEGEEAEDKPGVAAVDSAKWIWPNPPVHKQYLDATKKYGVNYIPRLEYGGSNALPQEAHVINGEGEYAKPTRFSQWGADTLHPATWTDWSRTVDNYFKAYAKDNPQLIGLHWHMRCDRMQMGYSRANVEQFCKETNTPLPAMTPKELAFWASNGSVKEQYGDWWHRKRAEFHRKTVELLKSYRPDLTLYYYNWDADKFALGQRDFNTAATFAEVAGARFGLVPEVYERHVRIQKSFTGDDYVNMIRKGNLTDWPGWGREFGLRTELYHDMPGIQLFGIMNFAHLANQEKYINYFRTPDGLAFSYSVSYDENGMRSINPKFEGNMVTPAGGPFSMAYELLAYFHGDARTLTYTVYTYGRGFAAEHRRFSQAFLALPATPGKVVEQSDPDVKIRTYETPNGTYIGVANKGFAGKKITVKVKAGDTTDLVTGQKVSNIGSFGIEAGPMSLNSFLIK